LLTTRLLAFRCACDVPAHAYSFSWEGNPYWSRAYVGALELHNYFKGRADAYGMRQFVRLNHQVTRAEWDEDCGRWKLNIKDLEKNDIITDEAEVLINATGFLKYVLYSFLSALEALTR
jgi:cation diffusion facilitator CzcD-associated flavoprotein CzcO